MKQTKAQRAVLKYLKENYPSTYGKFYNHVSGTHELNSLAGRFCVSILQNDNEFKGLLEEHTVFIDKYVNARHTLRLKTISFGIEPDFSCEVCGCKFILRSKQNFRDGKRLCSPKCIAQCPSTRQKFIETNIDRTGYAFPSQNPESRRLAED